MKPEAQPITLGQFMEEIEAYTSYVMGFHDPISPLRFDTQYNRVYVNYFTQDFIFTNATSRLSLCNISSVTKMDNGNAVVYTLVCNDFMTGVVGLEFTLSVE